MFLLEVWSHKVPHKLFRHGSLWLGWLGRGVFVRVGLWVFGCWLVGVLVVWLFGSFVRFGCLFVFCVFVSLCFLVSVCRCARPALRLFVVGCLSFVRSLVSSPRLVGCSFVVVFVRARVVCVRLCSFVFVLCGVCVCVSVFTFVNAKCFSNLV